MSVVSEVARLGGVAETRELRRNGVTPVELRRAVDAGTLVTPRRGCFALPDADPVAIAERAWHGTRTCVTAVERLGLPLIERDSRIHLSFPRGTSFGGRNPTLPAHIVAHYLPRTHRPLAPTLEALDSTVRCLARDRQLVLVDSALNKGLIEVAELGDLQLTGVQRRGWLARHSDPGAQSIAETLARVALVAAGLSVTTQVHIASVGYVDMVVNGRVIVEVDGRAYHSDPAAFNRDRRRDRAAYLAGYVPLRFTYAEVVYEPETVVAHVRRALTAR